MLSSCRVTEPIAGRLDRQQYNDCAASSKLLAMIEWLEILRCPVTSRRLRIADRGLLDRLNQEIAKRRLHDRLGRQLTRELDGALINADSTLAYPIYDRIPSLVADESIPLDPKSNEENPHE